MPNSYRVMVQVIGKPELLGNGVRYATRERAEFAADYMMTLGSIVGYRIDESEDTANILNDLTP